MNRTQLSIVLACLVAASPAYAHFKLMEPANSAIQDEDGNPQKQQPCGDGSATDTGPVTEYKTGGVVNILIDETVAHPGHYRVSLAATRAALPRDPDADVVSTGTGSKECTSLAINPNPTLPLLADGLNVKTTGALGPRTLTVTLPAGMTCDHCVLQVVQFMSNHPASCFYHHCANIKISATGPVGGAPDAGTGSTPDAGVGTGGGDAGVGGGGGDGGGGCSVTDHDASGIALLVLGVGLVLARRRRR